MIYVSVKSWSTTLTIHPHLINAIQTFINFPMLQKVIQKRVTLAWNKIIKQTLLLAWRLNTLFGQSPNSVQAFEIHFMTCIKKNHSQAIQLCLASNSMSAPTSAILVSLEALATLAMFPTSKSNAIFFTRPSSICWTEHKGNHYEWRRQIMAEIFYKNESN